MKSPPATREPSPLDLHSPCPVNREIYQELRRIAASRMARQAPGHTLQPTELVHEAWLRLRDQDRSWQDRGHFLASASLTMRRILIDHARRRLSRRRPAGLSHENPEFVATVTSSENLLLIDEGITELEQVHPVHARVVVARFFAGLTTPEIAEELEMSERSVERYWAFAKVWLMRWIARKT
ncbi:MAG TPA: ECF-type sigma factor [Opitutaceae bacterium]